MDNETHAKTKQHVEQFLEQNKLEESKYTIQYNDDGSRKTTRIWQPANGSYLMNSARVVYAGLTGRQRKRAKKHSYKLKKAEQVIDES